jgi:hypothetical protein
MLWPGHLFHRPVLARAILYEVFESRDARSKFTGRFESPFGRSAAQKLLKQLKKKKRRRRRKKKEGIKRKQDKNKATKQTRVVSKHSSPGNVIPERGQSLR